METHLKVTGSLLLVLAALHAAFPAYFKWKEELRSLSLINRQMMYVHTAFIALALLLMGLICLTATGELVETELGRKVSLGLAVFWTARLVVQFAGYSAELWHGKRFETTVHIAFSVLWLYFSGTFWLVSLK